MLNLAVHKVSAEQGRPSDNMVRDTEKQKTYTAEYTVRNVLDNPGTINMFGMVINVPEERRFSNVDDVQRYVDAVMVHIGRDEKLTVRARKGQNFAHYSRDNKEIAVPEKERWALRELVVLHEVAHHLTSENVASHGPEFRGNLCKLLGEVLGHEAQFLLQVEYGEAGLKVFV